MLILGRFLTAPAFCVCLQEVDIGQVYQGVYDSHVYRLISMVCFYGSHYHAFVFSATAGHWLMFDDTTALAVGDWDRVLAKCHMGRIQPSVLLFEHP